MRGERQSFSRKPRKCPKCGFSPVASILYGMPAHDEQMQQKIDEGRLVLGGCCVPIVDGPVWKCSKCGLEMCRK